MVNTGLNSNKTCLSLLPSPNISVNHIEHYNTVMFLNSFLNFSDLGIMIDNQACFKYAKEQLGLQKCSYRVINNTIANLYSNLTSSFRFPTQTREGNDPLYLSDLCADCAPSPQTNSLYPSLLPLKEYVPPKMVAEFEYEMNKDFKGDFSEDTPRDGLEESKVSITKI